MFVVNYQEQEWDSPVLIQSIHGPKLRVYMPTQHLEVLSLWNSDQDDIYETYGGYMPAKANDDDFWGENEEEDFWGE